MVSTTSSGRSSGSIRQFTLAAAVCGSALLAWPPSSRVATQVVRSTELNQGEPADSRRIAAVSPRLAHHAHPRGDRVGLPPRRPG